jgi:uncharacterized protein (DUF2267 family)
MDHSEFTGEVQHRIDAATQGETLRSIRAVLTTLGERIQEGEATDVASNLPMEIDYYVLHADSGQRFDYAEFIDRVAERANVDEADAAYQAQAIVAMIAEVSPGGEIDDLQEGLPDEFADLFEFVDADEVPW